LFFLLLGIIAVSVTTIINLLIVWWIDRFEKQPLWLLVLVFFWGAIPAIVTALIFSVFAGIPLYIIVGPNAMMPAYAIFGAPFIEELGKAAALFVLFLILYKEFEDILDGVIFGAAVGIGFAYTEDITYLIGSLIQGGAAMMGFVFFLRVIVFALNHAFFTALTGIGLGLARLSGNWFLGTFYAFFGLLAAMAAHAAHNFLVSIPGTETQVLGVAFSILIHWTAGVAFIILIITIWIIETGWVRRKLAEEVGAGYVTDYEINNLIRLQSRLKLQLKFLFNFDIIGYFRLRKLRNLLVKLAFKKRAYERAERKKLADQVEQLRSQIAAIRMKLAHAS
jgi:RsiW-degrading membrane proteinase PrsW (M82 family)